MTDFGIESIRDAAARLQGRIVETPLLESPLLNDIAGCRVLVKAESLQRTGSFKLRGALNCALQLSEAEQQAGFIAFSAGNHGQAVAAVAHSLGVPAVIVMPTTAPAVKVENCRWWGAEVVQFDPATEDREAIAATIQQERGLTLIKPFDDPRVMSGQGTAGLEAADELERQSITPDHLIVNVSGGGLAAGVSEALRDRFNELKVWLVEPAGRDKVAHALTGEQTPFVRAPGQTVMDALAGPNAGAHPVAALRRHSPHAVTVTDDEALRSVALAFQTLRLVLEPGGAASLAAVLANPEVFAGSTVVLIASGGNIDASVMQRALAMLE